MDLNIPLAAAIAANILAVAGDGWTTWLVLSQPGGKERGRLMAALIGRFGLVGGILAGKLLLHAPMVIFLALVAPWQMLAAVAALYAWVVAKNYRVYAFQRMRRTVEYGVGYRIGFTTDDTLITGHTRFFKVGFKQGRKARRRDA